MRNNQAISILNRTSLTFSDKFNLLSKPVGCQPHGAISFLFYDFGISRMTVYQQQKAVKQALHTLVVDMDEPEVSTTLAVDVAQLRRTIVALS